MYAESVAMPQSDCTESVLSSVGPTICSSSDSPDSDNDDDDVRHGTRNHGLKPRRRTSGLFNPVAAPGGGPGGHAWPRGEGGPLDHQSRAGLGKVHSSFQAPGLLHAHVIVL